MTRVNSIYGIWSANMNTAEFKPVQRKMAPLLSEFSDKIFQNEKLFKCIAAVYNSSGKELIAVNTLAPYILTCLIQKPKRLIYISSDMHEGGHSKLDLINTDVTGINYSDTKLHVLMLCKVVARKWSDVYANALNPGWVPTKMGGSRAPDDLKKGYETQVWLAGSNDENVKVSGHFFYHQKQIGYNSEADDVQLQERFLTVCKEVTGVVFPS